MIDGVHQDIPVDAIDVTWGGRQLVIALTINDFVAQKCDNLALVYVCGERALCLEFLANKLAG